MVSSFGSIPHAELLKSVSRRIVDRRVLHLIRMWLDCPVEETDDRGRKTRTTEARDKRRGIPQGSPLSPLLANIYMRRFVLGWKMFGLERSLGTRLITYADDLVILCRRGKAEAALQSLREIMGPMFILPPNCIVPSATSLTMRPVFPSFLYFISHTPCGRSGRHQIDTFESTWPGQNWALTQF